MIRLSPEAEADLRDISNWIARTNSPAVALRVHDRIVGSLRNLLDFPLMGRMGRVEGTRELVVAQLPYVAVYRPEADGILVIRILHGAMRWPVE